MMFGPVYAALANFHVGPLEADQLELWQITWIIDAVDITPETDEDKDAQNSSVAADRIRTLLAQHKAGLPLTPPDPTTIQYGLQPSDLGEDF